MMRVGFHPAAETELRAIATFYEGRMAGLGKEFVSEVDRVRRLIADYPALGAAYDPVHRHVRLRRFPFALIYRLDDPLITIVAIAHTRKRPGYWRGRV
jgi:plasmid stabilization system protein ParE